MGWPLSPYLFMLCTKGLICFLSKAVAEHQITGIRISRGAQKINHLMITNDSILFCEAKMTENKNLLNLYGDV